jgi:HAE1 family hydrophobic/amphiphilic exporter-1
VSANLDDRSLGAAVADVRAALAALPPPPGITVELGGQNEEMQVSFRSLRFALALAIFLVYLVMAATFESFLHPLIVMFTIPLALIGVVAALLATGIVVNNAIVLIDTINRYRRLGLAKREAVVRAGHARLRPILMTTATTVLGLLPMALSFGQGSELRSPLAITVAGGLLLSTVLTLVVIPAAYMAVPSTTAHGVAGFVWAKRWDRVIIPGVQTNRQTRLAACPPAISRRDDACRRSWMS